MKKIELMNICVANMAVLNIKLHNIHWNVVGEQFMPIHNFTEELYTAFFTKFDDVAEMIKIQGEVPASTMKQYLELSTVSEVSPRAFSTREALEMVSEDLTLMKKLSLEIRKLAEDEGDFSTQALFEEHCVGYDKNLWFLRTMLA